MNLIDRAKRWQFWAAMPLRAVAAALAVVFVPIGLVTIGLTEWADWSEGIFRESTRVRVDADSFDDLISYARAIKAEGDQVGSEAETRALAALVLRTLDQAEKEGDQ